jgi:hypothetical protein
MKEGFRIVTNRILRDHRTERRIIEMNRERFLYAILLLGAIFMLLALLW